MSANSQCMLCMTDLLGRFTNVALRDTCSHVGGEPARKLSSADRLIGSATLVSGIVYLPTGPSLQLLGEKPK